MDLSYNKELLDEWKDTKDSTALQAFIYELVGVDSKASSLFRGFRPQAIPNTPNGFRIPFRVKNGEIVPITDTEGTVHYLNFFDSVPSAGGRVARAAVQEFDTTPGANNEKATVWNRTPKDTSNLTAQTILEKRIIDVVINSLIFKVDPLYILADNSSILFILLFFFLFIISFNTIDKNEIINEIVLKELKNPSLIISLFSNVIPL